MNNVHRIEMSPCIVHCQIIAVGTEISDIPVSNVALPMLSIIQILCKLISIQIITKYSYIRRNNKKKSGRWGRLFSVKCVEGRGNTTYTSGAYSTLNFNLRSPSDELMHK